MKKIICFLVAGLMSVNGMADRWALPRLSVAHVRTRPAHSAEMSTQALMGMPLRIVDGADRQWIHVEMPDGYRGYIRSNSLVVLDDGDMAAWRRSPRVVVTSVTETKVYADKACTGVLSDVVDGDIMTDMGSDGRLRRVGLPDGRTGWISGDCVTDIDIWATQSPDADGIVAFASQHLGSPYTWGGNSSKGMDCSGLVKMAFLHYGVILRRDACLQARGGVPVAPDSLGTADLVFYGNSETGHVDHVAIYIGDDTVVESAGLVRYNRPACGSRYLSSRRVIGQSASSDIMPARSHPWYF